MLSKTLAYLNGMVCRLEATRQSYANLLASLHTLEARAGEQAGHLLVDPDPALIAPDLAPVFRTAAPPITSYVMPARGQVIIQNISTDQQAALNAAPPDGEGTDILQQIA